MNTIKCIIVDDEKAGRERLKKLLTGFKEIRILATEGDPEQAIELISNVKPDLVFLDIEMPRISGFELIKVLETRNINPKYVIVTAYDHYAIKAIKASALDYLIKPCDIDELKAAIKKFLPSHNKVIGHSTLNLLTAREKEIFMLIIDSFSSKEIAEKLFISKTTVDSHRKNILDKTGFRNINELVVQILNNR